jgi:predicted RNA binding protein YcfA (HicA-like mRNA interferase family)
LGLRLAESCEFYRHNPGTKRSTTIPNHPGVEIPKGTLKAILKQAGISLEDFCAIIIII